MSTMTRWHVPFTMALLLVPDVWNLPLWLSATDFEACASGSQVRFTLLRARTGKGGRKMLPGIRLLPWPYYSYVL